MSIQHRIEKVERSPRMKELAASIKRRRDERRLMELIAIGTLRKQATTGIGDHNIAHLGNLSEDELLSIIGATRAEYETALVDYVRHRRGQMA